MVSSIEKCTVFQSSVNCEVDEIINLGDSPNVLSGKMSPLKCCRCYISTISMGMQCGANKTIGP